MKLDMTISEKDKKLLMVLFSILIIAAAYYFGYDNIVDKTDQYQTEITSLRSKRNDLNSKIANRERFVEQTSTFEQQFRDTLASYANGTSQPTSIDFLNRIESLTGTWIRSVSFADPASIYNFGSKASSNPNGDGGRAYSTDMVGYRTTLTLSYQSEYGQFKDLLKFINEYHTKNTIDNITMAYDSATGYVSGTMSVSLYSIMGSDRTFEEPAFDVQTGTDNIFATE